jgi:hypothetical protein
MFYKTITLQIFMKYCSQVKILLHISSLVIGFIVMSDLILVNELKKGDLNGQVKLIQEWLCLHKETIKIDGDFGPATERAVKDFQNNNRIAVTGIVDSDTFAKLIEPMTEALREIIPDPNASLGDLVIAYANQHLLQRPREIGGQNSGPWVRLYMNGNQGSQWAWCAGFVCFCIKQACKTLNQPLPIKPSFSCDLLATSAKNNNRFVDFNAVTRGSLFLVRRTDEDWTHTGIVIDIDTHSCKTIEGNTNDDGSRDGYEVCMRTRTCTNLDFIRI